MTERIIIPPDDSYNQQLVSNVHPASWENPQPESVYNLVILGGGTAGLISAIATATLGGKVALVERYLLGGDCLNVGCVPSKSLLRPARLAHEMRSAAKLGLTPAEIAPDDFKKVMQRLRKIRAGISVHDSAARYRELGVDVFLGEGRFVSENTVEVGGDRLDFKKAVIATGARAVEPEITGLQEVGYLTNESIFDLVELPKSMLVVGGGPIGCELAQAFSRLGSKVTIIQRGHFLPREDNEAAMLLEQTFRKEGIEVILGAKTLSLRNNDIGEKVLLLEKEGLQQEVCGAEILIGAGRVPNVEGIGLEAAGAKYDLRCGVVVDDNLRTTNKRIFAAGDCCMDWKFTHAAEAAAQIVVQNALFKGRKRLSKLVIPWCTYTDPEIAHVGMYSVEAERKGLVVDYYKFDMKENDRAIADGDESGFVKVMVQRKGGKILGATVVAAHAGEMISEFATAIVADMTLGKLGSVIHPYPTQSEAIKRVAGLYNKSRLTPSIARVLKWWLKVQR